MKHKLLTLALFVLTAIPSLAQSGISGTVSDVNGEPLLGVAVYDAQNIRGGVVTDADGAFSIKVATGTVITFNCMGFKEI